MYKLTWGLQTVRMLERLDQFTGNRVVSWIIALSIAVIFNFLEVGIKSLIVYLLLSYQYDLSLSIGGYMLGSFVGSLFRLPLLTPCWFGSEDRSADLVKLWFMLIVGHLFFNDLLGNKLLHNLDNMDKNAIDLIVPITMAVIIGEALIIIVMVCFTCQRDIIGPEVNPLINNPDIHVQNHHVIIGQQENNENKEEKENKGYKEIQEVLNTSTFTLEEFERSFPIDDHSYLYCSISHELMIDPVILGETGHTYDRKEITEYLKVRYRDHHDCKDPVSNLKISNTKLTSNYDSREMILSRLKEQGRKIEV